jgi:hypothetical protein
VYIPTGSVEIIIIITYRNTLLGVDEAIKKLWTIVDSPNTEAKEKVKAITLIKEYYRERLDLIRAWSHTTKKKYEISKDVPVITTQKKHDRIR